MHIEKATEVTEELFSALQYLIPQLSVHGKLSTRNDLEKLIHSDASTLLLARHPGEAGGGIVGVLALIIYQAPTGTRAIVEDVVVDEKFRRMGIARSLLNRAIELAREAGSTSLSLTSAPNRRAANLLYRKMGFKPRETNPYILLLK
jgi:ribosomal protein S18 acetylase RimI-like enzyme